MILNTKDITNRQFKEFAKKTLPPPPTSAYLPARKQQLARLAQW
jgi:hypothetical protein